MSWWAWLLLAWGVGLPVATLVWLVAWSVAHPRRGYSTAQPTSLAGVSSAFTEADVGQVVRTSTGELFRLAAIGSATSVRLVPYRPARWPLLAFAVITGAALALTVISVAHGWWWPEVLAAGTLLGFAGRSTVGEYRRLRAAR